MSKFYKNVFLHKGKIHLRSIDNGQHKNESFYYKPYLFISGEGDNTPYRNIHGQPVHRIDFGGTKEAREYISKYSDVAGHTIYGMNRWIYPFIYDEYPGMIEYDPKKISVMNLDIENLMGEEDIVTSIKTTPNEITAVTLSVRGKIISFGCHPFNNPDPANIKYYQCRDEEHLLMKLVDVWSKLQPDVLSGWNISGYDIPYLLGRIIRVLGMEYAKRLSPWGIITPYDIEIKGETVTSYRIEGVAALDYLLLYKKFILVNRESYRLDFIAELELGEKKLDYSEYANLNDLFYKNFQKYLEYNIHDVRLIDMLDARLGLMELAFAMAYDAKINYEDVLVSSRQWDVIIHNHLLDKGVVVNHVTGDASSEAYAGGFVKDPSVGMHKWVVSFDLNSLYPSLIRQYNISPETFIKRVPVPSIDQFLADAPFDHGGYSMALNGCRFASDRQGFLPEIIERMYNDRVIAKSGMIDAEKLYEETKDEKYLVESIKLDKKQHSKKIQLNICYGVLANKHFRWFDINFAEAITLSGQAAIRWVTRDVNKYINKVVGTEGVDYSIMNDTDSCYFTLNAIVEKFVPDHLDNFKKAEAVYKFCEEKVQRVINDSFEQFAKTTNAFENVMAMKSEAIADTAVVCAKKKYAMNVYINEGVRYEKPKTKVVGLEVVRSSTPQVCRKSLKECIDIILTKDEKQLQTFVKGFREEYMKLDFEDIAFPRGISDILKYREGDKGIPIHVRASLVYNRHLKDKNLTGQYETIGNGDKIKFCYMRTPNPIMSNVLAVSDKLPPEFKLHDYIDYVEQYEKSFVKPLRAITDLIGWDIEKRNTLDSLFC